MGIGLHLRDAVGVEVRGAGVASGFRGVDESIDLGVDPVQSVAVVPGVPAHRRSGWCRDAEVRQTCRRPAPVFLHLLGG